MVITRCGVCTQLILQRASSKADSTTLPVTTIHHAPLRCTACVALCVLQSILTGESHSVEKHVESVHNPKAVYQDKVNILFSVSKLTLTRLSLVKYYPAAKRDRMVCRGCRHVHVMVDMLLHGARLVPFAVIVPVR